MTADPLTLDPDQREAALIEPSVRQIVLAPPGSGKTEVVAALVTLLVDDYDLSPMDEVMVLSFSRAAVAALRRRVLRSGGTAAPAVRTVDSFASRLLEELDEGDWKDLDFDARIVRATELVRDKGVGDDLSMVAHLVVDEVQDIVGVRAVFVLTLLTSLPETVGFTLLGDPRQSVYNFQLESAGGMTSVEFLEQIRTLPRTRELRLSGHYRARSADARSVAVLSSSGASGQPWLKEVRTFLAGLMVAGDVTSLVRPVQRWAGSTAFLCRDNGEALTVASTLREAGLPVTVRAAAEDAPIAPWLALCLADMRPSVSRDQVVDRLQAATGSGEDAWRLLKATERDFRSPDRLDVRRLAQRIAVRDVPAELLGSDTAISVSTIHRAKGLEFDNVVVVNPSDLLPGHVDEDEISVAYVALTRARDRIVAARCDVPRGLFRDDRTGRWVLGGHQRWQTFGFEVRGSDTRSDEDVDLSGPAGAAMPGDPVSAHLDPRRSSLETPVYSFLLGDQVVARTTPAFGDLLARRIGGISRSRSSWPRLTGVTVQDVETLCASTESPTLRLGVRVGGMARLEWSSTKGSTRG